MTTPLALQRRPNEPMASKESLLKAPTAKWDHASTKILLDICIEEIHKIGKPGIAFKSKIWEEIRDEFLKRANKDYTQKQLKNRMDTMRDNWSTWKQLLRSETGLGWNPQTRAIDAHATWWDAKIRENPNYKKFRYQGLEHHDELQFIFGDTVATSENAWTPAMGVPSGSSVKNIASDVPYEAVDIDDIEINLDDESSPVENSQSKKKRKVQQDMDDKVAKGKSKVRTATAMRKTLERLVQAAESHNEVEKEELAATSHLHGQYSIPNCVEVLKPLKDGGLLNGRQFSYALELMRDSQNRAIVMSLKDSMDNLVDWILVKIES